MDAWARAENGGHILHDGVIEPHTATEQRLLRLESTEGDLFAAGQNERIAAAYRRRARAVAFRNKGGRHPPTKGLG
jgi:hypothetical protein